MAEKAEQGMNSALERAEAHSPWLRRLMRRFPDVPDIVANGRFDAKADRDAVLSAEMDAHSALRIARSRLALAVGLADLAGLLPLEEAVAQFTDFADWAVDQAVRAAIEAHMPGADPVGFAVIALGKHGSRELNYSSDIDPIFLFDPETLPHKDREEPEEAAVRIGKRVLDLLQARDGDGYVLRVDLRLRPSPEVTPIVLPVNAALSYYESEALAWERAAFIRARACAGDVALGQRFLDAIRPFVWRRGLDFGAVQEIRAISHRIRDHYDQGQAFGAGYDLKRGRGGIRECEFFAQIHQLIHGGRDASLRVPATLDALAALVKAGRIEPQEAQTLAQAYRLYRTIEHRLQMVDDRQTHSLPADAAELDGVAKLHGVKDGKALLGLLRPHVEAVGCLYDALDEDGQEHLPQSAEALGERLGKAGFVQPDDAAQRVILWRSGTLRAVRSPAARDALEAVLPQLIEALGATADPMRAINQLSTLIERLPSAVNLFRLLEAQPALFRLLISILDHAPPLSEALARQPQLLDHLLDASAFDPPGSVENLARAMHGPGELEDQLNRVRQAVGDMRFGLGVQLIEGSSDPLGIAGGYARVAEAAIQMVAAATIAEFEEVHGKVPGSELVILALGRLGGSELTHASDLDVIFLFTGDFDGESDGRRPLGAVLYYNRLSQRVVAGLSVPTAAGALYQVDTRLRPSGAKGPLAVSLEGFRLYQANEAWTWEHMALCRARAVFGSADARAAAEAIISNTLSIERDVGKLLADAREMRSDIETNKPPKSDLDVKLAPGGLVDLEFALHVTQLRSGMGLHPNLGETIGALVAGGLAPAEMVEAHAHLTRTLLMLRLLAPDLETPDPATCAIISRGCGVSDWSKWLEATDKVRQSVARFWGDASKG